MNDTQYHPVVNELVALIAEHEWKEPFAQAIKAAHRQNIPQIDDIHSLADYLSWINALLTWIPNENAPGSEVYVRLCKFYFILDQEPLLSLQNKVVPDETSPALTPLSAWLVRYADAMGQFLDTPASLTPGSL